MRAFDHSKPANRDEWLFAFIQVYRELRPEIGERYAKTHAVSAYSEMAAMPPKDAARAWFERSRPSA